MKIEKWMIVPSVVAAAGAAAVPARAAPVFVANHSFESPDTTFATSTISGWQKTGREPDREVQTGIFENSSPFVQGADGQQLGFVFSDEAAVGADRPGIFQSLMQGSTPITYQVGQSYRLTVGAQGGGGGMQLNVPLSFQLYYVDPTITAGDNRVTIASTTYRNDNASGQITRLTDYSADLATVTAGQAWANRQIGIRIVAPADPGVNESGYFDIDNVRLTAVPEPATAGLLATAAGFGLLRRRRRGLGREGRA